VNKKIIRRTNVQSDTSKSRMRSYF